MLATRRAVKLRMAAEGAPRVRFAPSPTGTLHVGGARTALYNWLVARQSGGQFILRIEDTDTARSTRESEEAMKADLRWLGLDWDEGPEVEGPNGPYRQSERGEKYVAEAKKLMEEGHAYPCFCSEEELEAKRAAAEEAGEDPTYDGTWRDADEAVVAEKMANGEPYTVRFKVPKGKVVTIDDAVRGSISWDAEKTVGDFILLRSTGVPVYNFCVAVDDADMGITTVIRAEEHLTNTLRQCLILDAMGKARPNYAHCSLILGEDRSKLSKRHGATSVDQFRREGFVREAMVNYLSMLGWNDGTDQEIYSVDEVREAFDLSRVVKSPSVFDGTKLRWVNGQHLKAMPLEDLSPLVEERLREAGALDGVAEESAFATAAAALSQQSMSVLTDAKDLVDEAFAYDLGASMAKEDASHIMEDNFPEIAAKIVAAFDSGDLPVPADAPREKADLQAWEQDHADAFKKWVKALGKDTGRKGKGLFHPVRLALTGAVSGPDIAAQLRLLALADVAGAPGDRVSLEDRVNALREVAKVAA